MAETILNTRIQLKYDTLANWNASTFLLKRGELAIVEVPTAEGTTLPPVMFKVGTGDKKFSELDWASAKAADVYSWAKASGLTVEDNGSGKFVTGFTWTDNKLVITRSDVDWSDIQNKPLASATADGLMSSADKAKLDGMNLTTGAGVKAEVASSLDAAGVAQVKAIKVDNATNADEATHATNAGTADKVAHTLTIDDKTFDGSTNVDITATVKSLAATEIGRLIDVAGDDETLTNIGALVDYVENNAGEIAQLVTDVGTANTNASNAVSTANTAKSTAEDAASVAGEAKSLAEDAMDAASGAQTGAAASAAAAAESAEAAADSAANALAEKNAAVEAKTAAVNAQAAAETAEDAAEGYAADALASKNAASDSESAAATSASQAATSAGTASTKAGEAATSAANALASENAAAQSKADANSAKEAAEAAQQAAEKAKSDANDILTEVSDVASGAQATANSAVQTANTANQTANEAKSAAEGAVSTANAAKAAADTALQEIEAGDGLKVTTKANNKQTISIDDSVVFVFDCGNATDKIYE